ncbi:ubiquitin-like domain-containing protein [Streptomyces sp. NPDC001093]|uniref:ubiquitin-like domain-containing protein n=1 Tax=Streptomyces sp. NPDC001093 TaxID=3154376 RepID=UPI0033244836
MSKSQYEAFEAYEPYWPYETFEPYGSYGPYGPYEPYGTDTSVHTAETLSYGGYGPYGPYGPYELYEDTYRPAYEAQAHFVADPVLPRQGGSGVPWAGSAQDAGGAGGPQAGGDMQAAGGTQTAGGAAGVAGAPGVLGEEGECGAGVSAGVSGRADRRRKARCAERPESAVRRLLPQALVVAFLAGGTTAFVAKDKAVELTVEGKQRTLHTFADDVRGLLAEEGVRVGAHDMVAPAPGKALTSGDAVAVRYGRPVRLTLDGQRREVWTTAHTVAGALDELGVRAEGAYLSASGSQTIGRAGLALDVRTERAVTIMADGRSRTIRTNAATVREAVEEAGIGLQGQDTTSVPLDSFPRDGQTVTVLRIKGSREVREEEIPFDVERTDDPSLFKGTEVVTQVGQPGLRRDTYLLRIVNGVREKPRREKSEVVRKPRKQVVKVGTKARPTSVKGADHLNWHGLAACESGGRPHAVDPSGTFGGLYQFDIGTWHALGGSGRPQDAPVEEQTFRAKKLYTRRGSTPWPSCGARLHG